MRNKLTSLLIVATLLMTTIVSASPTVMVEKNPYKDPSKAFNYVYKLCITDNTGGEWASYMLGSYYERGYGTKPNIRKAYAWYKMSTDQDYKPAVAALKKLKKTMTKKQITNAEKYFIKIRDTSIKKETASWENINK